MKVSGATRTKFLDTCCSFRYFAVFEYRSTLTSWLVAAVDADQARQALRLRNASRRSSLLRGFQRLTQVRQFLAYVVSLPMIMAAVPKTRSTKTPNQSQSHAVRRACQHPFPLPSNPIVRKHEPVDIARAKFDRASPSRLDASLDVSNRHIWHIGLMTLLSACLTIPVLVMSWAPVAERGLPTALPRMYSPLSCRFSCTAILPQSHQSTRLPTSDRDGSSHCPEYKRCIHILSRPIWLLNCRQSSLDRRVLRNERTTCYNHHFVLLLNTLLTISR